MQWSSGGECRISEDDRSSVSEAIDDCEPGKYRSLFPMHGPFGALQLHIDGHTVWLYTAGGAYIAGELVDPAVARARSLPASGTVDISSLPTDQQAAIMTLLQGSKKRK
jgi:hypothetical protein